MVVSVVLVPDPLVVNSDFEVRKTQDVHSVVVPVFILVRVSDPWNEVSSCREPVVQDRVVQMCG